MLICSCQLGYCIIVCGVRECLASTLLTAHVVICCTLNFNYPLRIDVRCTLARMPTPINDLPLSTIIVVVAEPAR